MNLKSFLAKDRIRPHKTSRPEISDLLRIVERDLTDASIPQLSTDRRFATAYNAALQLATLAMYAEGYKPTGLGHHWVTFKLLPELMGNEFESLAGYFDLCRSKRNLTDYDRSGEISQSETAELIEEAANFQGKVLEWLKAKHPELLA